MQQYPDVAALAQEAYDATGCKTHPQFCALTRGAVKVRTFRRWLAGDGPMDEMARQYFVLVKAGWRPPA